MGLYKDKRFQKYKIEKYQDFFTRQEQEYLKKMFRQKEREIKHFENTNPLQLTERDRQELIELGISIGELCEQWREYSTNFEKLISNKAIPKVMFFEIWSYVTNKTYLNGNYSFSKTEIKLIKKCWKKVMEHERGNDV